MSDSTEKSAYFYRIILLVVDVGTETLRDTFYSKVPKADVLSKFSSPEIAEEFKQLNSKRVLNKAQYEKVTVNPDPDNYDITLLLVLLTNKKISGISQPTNGWGGPLDPEDDSLGANLVRLREIRNELVGHRANTQMQETEFTTYWGKIEAILKKIASFVDQAVEDKITQKIKDAQTRILEPLDDREQKLLQVFLQWRKEEDEKNEALLTSVQISLQNLYLKVDGIKTPTDESDAVRTEDTLSSLQSQVNSVDESLGGVAQQNCVQEIHRNEGNMTETINKLCQAVELFEKQLEEYRKVNKRYKQEIAQPTPTSGTISKEPQIEYQIQPQTIPKIRNPHAMSEKEIMDLNKKNGTRSKEPQIVYQRQPQTRPKIRNPNAMSEKEIMDLNKKNGSEWEQPRIHLDSTQAQSFALKKAYDDDTPTDETDAVRTEDTLSSLQSQVNSVDESLGGVEQQNCVQENVEDMRETIDKLCQEVELLKKQMEENRKENECHKQEIAQLTQTSGRDCGGRGSLNMYGGKVKIEGSLSIHSSQSSTSDSSLVSSDGLDGGRPTSASHSINMYDGELDIRTGAHVFIGPPTSIYPSQSNTATVRREGSDDCDSGQPHGRRSEGCGQPF